MARLIQYAINGQDGDWVWRWSVNGEQGCWLAKSLLNNKRRSMDQTVMSPFEFVHSVFILIDPWVQCSLSQATLTGHTSFPNLCIYSSKLIPKTYVSLVH